MVQCGAVEKTSKKHAKQIITEAMLFIYQCSEPDLLVELFLPKDLSVCKSKPAHIAFFYNW